MEENFEPVARTRANYYTPGSPVQFVCVELLKGEISGEHAVCLTFKNISKVTLTALEIHFKCKGVDGIILCEDEFEYRDIAVKPGESFGMDDAVFVTQKAITSVDVSLKNVYNGKRVVHLDAIKRVRLPAPRRLSPELQKALEARMNRQGLKYMPQVFENGWYCACGAFHPKEEDTVYCTECGCDRILLQNALNTLLQPGQKAAPAEQAPAAEATRVVSAAPQEEPTRIVASAPVQAEPTRVIPTARPAEPVGAPTSFAPPVEHTSVPEAEPTRVLDAATRAKKLGATITYDPNYRANLWKNKEDAIAQMKAPLPLVDILKVSDEELPLLRDGIAETLVRWVPPITAIVCAGIALWGFVYYQFMM